jgi:hypothetical protein
MTVQEQTKERIQEYSNKRTMVQYKFLELEH